MPLQRCEGDGWRYGRSGRCYHGQDAKKRAIRQGLAIGHGTLEKTANVELHLHVVGVQAHPSGQRVYRLATRDGHYVGRTNPTRTRAVKGDVLRVTAAHVWAEQSGDVSWQNVDVAGLANRRADSHRSLLERIGGGNVTPEAAMLKDDGVPPTGDEGTIDPADTENVPTGPTSNSVHVNRPLRNVSIHYGNRRRQLRIVKALDAQQLVYGVVLEPDVIDSQADFVPAAHVEKAAHRYLEKALRGKASVTKLQHRTAAFHSSRPSVVPVESFIAPVDFTYPGSRETVKKGSWVMAVHVEDPALWQDFLDGRYDGFSVGGSGLRQRFGSMLPARPPIPA